MKKWIFPSETSFSNWASVGEGSVPLKPPIGMTDRPVASWYPAASLAPTVAATHSYFALLASRAAVSALLGALPLSRPPVPPPRPPKPPPGGPGAGGANPGAPAPAPAAVPPPVLPAPPNAPAEPAAKPPPNPPGGGPPANARPPPRPRPKPAGPKPPRPPGPPSNWAGPAEGMAPLCAVRTVLSVYAAGAASATTAAVAARPTPTRPRRWGHATIAAATANPTGSSALRSHGSHVGVRPSSSNAHHDDAATAPASPARAAQWWRYCQSAAPPMAIVAPIAGARAIV